MITSIIIYVLSLLLIVINFVLPNWSLPGFFLNALEGLRNSTYWLEQFFPVSTLFYAISLIILFEISYFILRLFLGKRIQ